MPTPPAHPGLSLPPSPNAMAVLCTTVALAWVGVVAVVRVDTPAHMLPLLDVALALVLPTLVFFLFIRALIKSYRDWSDQLASVLLQARDGVLICDSDTRIAFVNPAFCAMLGYESGELLGQPLSKILHAGTEPLSASHLADLEDRSSRRRLWSARHQLGSLFPVEVTAQRLADGRYLAVASAATENGPTPEAIALERQRLLTLLNTLPDAVWLKDQDGRYLACNAALAQFFGRQSEQILSQTDHQLHPQAIADTIVANDRKVMAGGGPVVFHEEVQNREGTHYYEATKAPVYDREGKSLGTAGVARNITAQVITTRALAASERWFRAVFDAATDDIFVADLDARFVNVNQRACANLGYSREELLAMGIVDINPEFSLAAFKARTDSAAFVTGYTLAGRHRRKDGSTFPVEIHTSRLTIDDQTYSLSIVRNISTQRAAEDALQASEAFSRAVLDAIPAQTAVVNRAGAIVAVNGAWLRFATEHAGVGQAVARAGVGVNFIEVCRRAGDLGTPSGNAVAAGIEAVLACRSGSYAAECPCDTLAERLWFLLAVSPLANNPGHAIVSYTDITPIKAAQEMEKQLGRQFKALADKYQEIQENERHHLSRELHDHIGQNLAALKLYLHGIKAVNGDPVEVMRAVEVAGSLLDDITWTVRYIARGLRPPLLDERGLQAALEALAESLKISAAASVVLETDIDDRRFDPMIELACYRIIQESIANALRHAEASTITVHVSCAGERLCLYVQDDGRGFEVNASLRDAEPQVSLGLIGMRERAEAAAGTFAIHSLPNAGTTVSACFPRNPSACNPSALSSPTTTI